MIDESTLAEHTPKPGSVSYYAQVFTAPRHRTATGALYALVRALDSARDGVDPGVARLKLQWWHDELQRLAAGEPRHPITQALHQAGMEAGPEVTTLADSRETELAHEPQPTWEALQQEALRSTGLTLELWSQLLEHPLDVRQHPTARSLSLGLHLNAALQRCHAAARRGRSTLPSEWLEQAGISLGRLCEPSADDATRRLLSDVATRAAGHLEQALEEWPRTQGAAHLPLLVTAELRRHILTLQNEGGFQRLDRRFTTTPLRKLWRAWRVRRRYGRPR